MYNRNKEKNSFSNLFNSNVCFHSFVVEIVMCISRKSITNLLKFHLYISYFNYNIKIDLSQFNDTFLNENFQKRAHSLNNNLEWAINIGEYCGANWMICSFWFTLKLSGLFPIWTFDLDYSSLGFGF